MLVTTVKQQRTIGRAARAAGGYFKLAKAMSERAHQRENSEMLAGSPRTSVRTQPK